jgi:hypothetical protein
MVDGRPQEGDPYSTMAMIQWNAYLEHGALVPHETEVAMSIDYGRIPDAVRRLLTEVLKLQVEGDEADLRRFVAERTTWRAALHRRVGERMLAAEPFRYRQFRFGVLGAD